MDDTIIINPVRAFAKDYRPVHDSEGNFTKSEFMGVEVILIENLFTGELKWLKPSNEYLKAIEEIEKGM